MSIDYTRDIRTKLQFLCDKQIDSLNQSPFFGKDAVDSTADDNFINQVVSYDNFQRAWLPSLTQQVTLPLLGILMARMCIRNPTNKVWYAYSPSLVGMAFNTDLSNLTKETYLNFTNLLKDGGEFYSSTSVSLKNPDTITFANLLNLLNTIRITYNLLGERPFAMYKNALMNGIETIEVPVPLYELEPNGSTFQYKTVADMVTINGFVEKLIPNVRDMSSMTSNLDAMRRVLYGYELMIHVYIATRIFYLGKDIQLSGTEMTYAENLLKSTIYQIREFNNSMYQRTGVGSVGELNNMLEQRVKDYARSKASIEDLGKQVDDAKLGISLESNNVSSNNKFLKKNQVVFITFLVLTLLSVLALVIANLPFVSKSASRLINLGVVALASASLVILYYLNHTTLREPFGVEGDNAVKDYLEQALQSYSEYVSNSLYLALVLNTYKRYGDISNSIKKEYNYYDNTSIYLKQNQETLQSMQVDAYRKGKVMQYRVYLFLQVLLTIAIISTILLYVPSVKKTWLTIIGGLVLLVWVYFYILNSQGIVHTDASKLYWNPPLIDKDL